MALFAHRQANHQDPTLGAKWGMKDVPSITTTVAVVG